MTFTPEDTEHTERPAAATKWAFMYNVCPRTELPWERRRPRRLAGTNIDNY
jgi:hypothetical protein